MRSCFDRFMSQTPFLYLHFNFSKNKIGTSSLKNHLQNGALDDLDLMTLGLAMSNLRGQYNDRCLCGSMEDLDPSVILAFDHNGFWALTLLSGSAI